MTTPHRAQHTLCVVLSTSCSPRRSKLELELKFDRIGRRIRRHFCAAKRKKPTQKRKTHKPTTAPAHNQFGAAADLCTRSRRGPKLGKTGRHAGLFVFGLRIGLYAWRRLRRLNSHSIFESEISNGQSYCRSIAILFSNANNQSSIE